MNAVEHEWEQTGWEYDDSFFRCKRCHLKINQSRGLPARTETECVRDGISPCVALDTTLQVLAGGQQVLPDFIVSDAQAKPTGEPTYAVEISGAELAHAVAYWAVRRGKLPEGRMGVELIIEVERKAFPDGNRTRAVLRAWRLE